MEQILVCQLARMGDIIQSLYLLQDLKQGGGAKISVLVDKRLVGFLRDEAPWLDAVYGLDMEQYLGGFRNKSSWISLWESLAKELQPLISARFDRIINLNYGKLASAVVNVFCKDTPVDGFFLTSEENFGDPWVTFISRLVQTDRRLNRFHLTDVFRFHGTTRMSASALPSKPWRVLDNESILAVQVATRHSKRTWDPEGFVRVIEHVLNESGARVVLLGEKGELPPAEYITRRISSGRLENLVGKTTLKDLVEVLSGCDRLLSGDTGTLHLGCWLGTPSVAIFFGPACAFETGPYGPGHFILQSAPPCAPCKEDAPCDDRLCSRAILPETLAALLQADPGPSGVVLDSYRSEFVEGWIRYQPLQKKKADVREILGLLYWGGIGEFLGSPMGKLPSLTTAVNFLAENYHIDREMMEMDYPLVATMVPHGFSDNEKMRMTTILQNGWRQLQERGSNGFGEESFRLAATSA